MKVKKVVVVVMFFLTVVLFSENRPRVAILDFKATGVSSEHAEIVTEIFRSKVITSSVFDVLERKNLENIMMENSLALSGLVEKPAEIGKLLGAEYLITGSFMKMGNKLLLFRQLNIVKELFCINDLLMIEKTLNFLGVFLNSFHMAS